MKKLAILTASFVLAFTAQAQIRSMGCTGFNSGASLRSFAKSRIMVYPAAQIPSGTLDVGSGEICNMVFPGPGAQIWAVQPVTSSAEPTPKVIDAAFDSGSFMGYVGDGWPFNAQYTLSGGNGTISVPGDASISIFGGPLMESRPGAVSSPWIYNFKWIIRVNDVIVKEGMGDYVSPPLLSNGRVDVEVRALGDARGQVSVNCMWYPKRPYIPTTTTAEMTDLVD